MIVTVFVPGESTARSLGADGVAAAVVAEAARRGEPVRVVRTGSRGLFFLEPLVEIDTPTGRHAYGPVRAADVPRLFDAGFLRGPTTDALALGPVADIPYLARQQRLTCARLGVVDPLDVDDYVAHGGFRGLHAALAKTPEAIVADVTDSGLRGRGGAAFPTGIKWRTVREAASDTKYVVCNADEGDSGTFVDRLLMEGDPFLLIEGMIIAGLAIGASRGYVYARWEYVQAARTFRAALERAYAAGWLGADVAGSGRRFDLELRLGAGAYVCGEETALLESLEGRRGQVRPRPPLPAHRGLFGQPTLVNNLLTLAAVPQILEHGPAFYRDFGLGRSRGTLTVQLAGNVARGGLVELAFGATLRELIYEYGGGTRSGRPVRAVQVGGPLGAYWPPDKLDVPLDYEAFAAANGMVGHGGVVVFDDTVDVAEQARYALEFCAIESCGKCTPCRIGSTRGVEVIDRLLAGEAPARQEALLRDLCDTMQHGSLCALGGLTPLPVRSALDYFRQDFTRPTVRVAAGG